MSIVAFLAEARMPASPAEKPASAVLVCFALWAVTSIAAAYATRPFRRPFANSPVRWGASDTIMLLLGLVLAGFAASILGAIPIYPFVAFMPEPQRSMTAAMLAGIVTFAVIIILNAALRQDGLEHLGLTPRGVQRGFIAGFTGFFIILPWVFWLMLLESALLNRLKIHAPTEHPIFEMWRSSGRAFHVLAYISAVLIAPLAEESLFRGMIQTMLARLFNPRIYWPQPPAPPLPPPPQSPPPAPDQPAPILDYTNITPPPPAAASPLARWLAIIVTSLIFASIHRPLTIQPPIFLLSLGLGYVYERTGNLWSSIFMHMLFNAFQFTLFLL